MEHFWAGFEKRASDVLSDWEKESETEEAAAKSKKRELRVSPVELSMGYAPDTWPRYAP